MFECRVLKTMLMIKLDPENLVVRGEDEVQEEKKPDPSIMLEPDGTTRVIGNQRYKQTKSNAWRMVDATGNFFVKNSKRPDDILSHMWREIQRQNKATQRLALVTMNRIIMDADPEIMSERAWILKQKRKQESV